MTGSSLGTLAVLALAAAASPFSLIAFSLVLATDRGPKNGLAFIAGWITTVMLIGAIGLAVGGSIHLSEGTSSGDVTYGIQIALGVVLLMVWTRRRIRGPVERVAVDKPVPGWQRRIATMRAPGAFVLGGAVQTWPVMLAGVAEIARDDMSNAESVVWLLLFAITTAAGIGVLEVLALRSPGGAAARLDRIRTYVATHRDTVMSWVVLGGGIWLTARGLIGILS